MFLKKIVSGLLKDAELRKEPIIIRVSKFDDESAAKFVQQMSDAHNTGQGVIPIVISSPGGSVYSLMEMIAAIENTELPVSTIIEGRAMSCGAVLATFGEDGIRFCDPNATIMIHDVASGSCGKVEDLKVSAAEADRLNDKIYKMMARNCGHPDDYFLKIADKKKHADWFMDAEEAKKHNIVNHIHVPSMTVSINVDIEFE